MSIRYSIKKSLILGRYYVYDHIEMQCAFRGSYEDCHDWIDNPLKLALKQGEAVKKALEKDQLEPRKIDTTERILNERNRRDTLRRAGINTHRR